MHEAGVPPTSSMLGLDLSGAYTRPVSIKDQQLYRVCSSYPKNNTNIFNQNALTGRLAALFNQERGSSSTFFRSTIHITICGTRDPGVHMLIDWSDLSAREMITVRAAPGHKASELEIFESDDNQWLLARDWFRRRYVPSTLRDSEHGSYNNTEAVIFPFMRLPPELRVQVLEEAIGRQIWPHPRKDNSNDSSNGIPQGEAMSTMLWHLRNLHPIFLPTGEVEIDNESESDYKDLPHLDEVVPEGMPPDTNQSRELSADRTHFLWPEDISIHRPSEDIDGIDSTRTEVPVSGMDCDKSEWIKNLLLVNREIRYETQRLIWQSSSKHFQDICTLATMVPRLQSITSYNTLRHISLSFTNIEYFQFIGFVAGSETACSPYRSPFNFHLEDLARLPNLHHLHSHFEIRRPLEYADDTYCVHDPWWMVGSRSSKVNSCQKTLVDWFFTLAYQSLQNVPKITFSGHVKDSTRRKWDDIFNRRQLSGFRLDIADDVDTIMSMPMSAV
jgi:hypothetical protein